jgi:hypothetical protein
MVDAKLCRMKLLALAAVLAWGFAPQAAKPANSGPPAKSAAAHANNPVTPAKRTDSVPAISAVPNDEVASQRAASGPSALEVKMTWFAGTLAAVAVLQFFALLWQTLSLRKLAKASSTRRRWSIKAGCSMGNSKSCPSNWLR